MKDTKISKEAFEAWYGPDSTTDVTLGCGEWSEEKRAAWEVWQAAIEAERNRILKCIEEESNIALSKYEDSLDHYWAGADEAFYKAEQIVKGEN